MPKRRWFKFSLRTLLILVAVLAVPCAWVGGEINRVRNMRRAVEIIESHHGTIQYDYQRPGGLKGPIDYKAQVTAPRWLRDLLGDDYFRSVNSVFLHNRIDRSTRPRPPATPLSDEEWAVIGTLTSLEILGTENLPIRDESVRHLRGLTNLKALYFRDADLTDESARVIARFHQLELLGFGNFQQLPATFAHDAIVPSRLTDKTLAAIENLKNLTSLELDGAQITDAGLVHLKGMTQLTRLSLLATNVGDEGMKQLVDLPLETMQLKNTKVTNEGARLLTSIPSLRTIGTFSKYDEATNQIFRQRSNAFAAAQRGTPLVPDSTPPSTRRTSITPLPPGVSP